LATTFIYPTCTVPGNLDLQTYADSEPSDGCVILYTDSNFGGNKIVSCTELTSLSYNDQISSVKVGKDVNVYLYQNDNYGGSVKILKNDGYFASIPDFNDSASSLWLFNVNTNALTHRTTPMNDDGSGNIIYLDRHTITCNGGNQAVNEFKLVRSSSGTQLQYDYHCIIHDRITNTCSNFTTNWSDGGPNGSSINFLDRHLVLCGDTSVLKTFKLATQGSLIRYEYTCCNITTGANSPVFTSTTHTDQGSRSTIYLDRQNVDAGAGFALQGFQAQTGGSITSIWYNIKKIKLSA